MSITAEAAAACVQLVPNPAQRGGKRIVVGDETWGRVEMRQHGGAGASYIFFDADDDPVGKCGDKTKRFIPHVVYGDKMQTRRERGNVPIAPVADRVIGAVRYMIRAAMLQSPSDLRLKAEAERATRAERYATAAAEELAEFRAKADEIANTLPSSCSPKYVLAVSDKIIEAMRWAQTK